MRNWMKAVVFFFFHANFGIDFCICIWKDILQNGVFELKFCARPNFLMSLLCMV